MLAKDNLTKQPPQVETDANTRTTSYLMVRSKVDRMVVFGPRFDPAVVEQVLYLDALAWLDLQHTSHDLSAAGRHP